MSKLVFIIATLDTKGREAAYVTTALEALGVNACLLDASTRRAATQSRVEATGLAARAVGATLMQAHAAGTLAGVLALGGSVGTQIAAAAMQALPLGVPKLIVSTMASGQVRPYVGAKDIIMMNSVADISGLNRITCGVLDQAAAAVAGMCKSLPKQHATGPRRPLVVATMFGITTSCVQHARDLLEAAGCEVVIFSANGIGGRTMESFIKEGGVAGVLDITTTELADEVAEGVLSAGPDRLLAAVEGGIPQVVSVGATDAVNFGAMDTVPSHLRGRTFHVHSDNVTLMRSNREENIQIGLSMAAKLRDNLHTTILLPSLGVSALDKEGEPFDDPDSRRLLFESLHAHVGCTQAIALDHHINDPAFAEHAVAELLRLMKATES